MNSFCLHKTGFDSLYKTGGYPLFILVVALSNHSKIPQFNSIILGMITKMEGV